MFAIIQFAWMHLSVKLTKIWITSNWKFLFIYLLIFLEEKQQASKYALLFINAFIKFWLLSIFVKSSIINLWQCSECRPSGAGGGEIGGSSDTPKSFVDVPFFSKRPWNALSERSNQKCTWKLIIYKSKLKLKT